MTGIVLTKNIFHTTKKIKIRDLVDMHTRGLLAADKDHSQRIINDSKWNEKRKIGYLTSLFNEAGESIQFLFLDLEETIKRMEKKTKKISTQNKIDIDALDHLKSFAKDGAKFLSIDGQNRFKTILAFINNEISLKSKTSIITQKKGEEGVNKVEGLFSELTEYQRNIFLDIEIECCFYETDNIYSVSDAAANINKGVAWTNHEMRIMYFTDANRWIIRLCNLLGDDLKNTLRSFSKVAKEYDPQYKGDTYFACHFLLWNRDQSYEFTEKEMNEAFGKNATITFSKSDYELTEDQITQTISLCGAYQTCKSKKLGNHSGSALHNLMYTVSFLQNPNNRIVKEYAGQTHKNTELKLDSRYAIINEEAFAKWFFRQEDLRMAEGAQIEEGVLDKKGNPKLVYHSKSFNKHSKDLKHSIKSTEKKIGGARYTFPKDARYRYLLADLEKDLPTLEAEGVIKKIETRAKDDRKKMAALKGLSKSSVEGYSLDHIHPISKGGKTTLEGTRFIPSDRNRYKSDSYGVVLEK